MTISWGHKLTIAFIAFALFILMMVYKSVRADFQLVSADYYKEELNYQQVIDGTGRANNLPTPLTVTQNENELIIQLPLQMNAANTTGIIWLYCPADEKKDRKLNLTVDENGKQSIAVNKIIPAAYIVKVNWQTNGQQFYNEQSVLIK